MLWGEYAHRLDEKGRLIIPARFRPHLEGAMLTRGFEQNLVIYPQATWRLVTEQVNEMPITIPASRSMRRIFYSGAVTLEVDRQGRAPIPPHLREYAQLSDEVLLIGLESFIELWNPALWQSALQASAQETAEQRQQLRLKPE